MCDVEVRCHEHSLLLAATIEAIKDRSIEAINWHTLIALGILARQDYETQGLCIRMDDSRMRGH